MCTCIISRMFIQSHVTYELSATMSKVKERDEQEALKLDERYKRILVNVRPYISNLRSLEEARLCMIWLDKLNATISQRNLRNEYLLELLRQLKASTLEGIFRTQPPVDSLMPLPSSRQAVCISSSLSSELSDYDRNHHNCLSLNRKSSQKNYLHNKMRFHGSDSTIYTTSQTFCHVGNTVEKNHLKFCKQRIDMLTVALENFQIQNEQLKQELGKYRENKVDNEVLQLQNHVKQLTGKTQSESLTWKVRSLKKTIAKLKKLNSTVENVYEKKLQRIVKNKNLEIKVLQLQFQEQTNNLFLSLCSEKQKELHSLVSSLEKRYKALLINADAAIENQREEYITKIAALEAELCHLRNNLRSKSEYV